MLARASPAAAMNNRISLNICHGTIAPATIV
jgi:hypothetical protein